MSLKLKLTYFNGRGLAELSRLILAQAGADYEDVRIEREQWPELKPTMPFGQLPILEVEGQVISQSRAIARYLANQFKLTGSNPIEAAKIDMLVDAVYDVLTHLSTYRFEQDPVKKEELGKKFVTEILPPYIVNFEKILTANNSGTGFFVGDQISWADLSIAYALNLIKDHRESLLDGHDLLKSFSDRILNLPNVKAWIDKRPVTEF